MLYPPIDELVKITGSKYALVTIAAQRARSLLENNKLMLEKPVSHSYVGKALEELYHGKISYKRK
jgi:DNA-directed RNA polymerase subunit omega